MSCWSSAAKDVPRERIMTFSDGNVQQSGSGGHMTSNGTSAVARDSAKKLGPKMYVQCTGLTAVFGGHEDLREREPAARRAPSAAMVSLYPPLHYFYAIF